MSLVGRARKILGQPGAFSEKYLMWRHLLRTSLTGLTTEVLELVLGIHEKDFDYSQLHDSDWLVHATPEEVLAYRRGARAMGDAVFARFVKNFGGDAGDLIHNARSGSDLEERLARHLDEEARLPGGSS